VSKVSLIGCNSYDHENVYNSVLRGINLLGGFSQLLNSNDRILLKPNLLTGEKPEKCVTTHPEVFRAVGEILSSEGNLSLSYGDSPAFGSFEKAARIAGIKKVADSLGIKTADFKRVDNQQYPQGILLKRIPLAKGVGNIDSLISISKMKTHALTRITGAVKNQFGCVPGILKGEFHVKMPDIEDFSKMLIDINNFIKPKLFIMDGIMAMEGNGPRSGNPVPMNVLLFSTDPVAIDTVFCKLIGLNPSFVPTIKLGHKYGLGTSDLNEIDIIGDKLNEYRKDDFTVERKPYEKFDSKKHFPFFLKNIISPKPVIDYDLCKNCGKCVLQCPTDPKAVNWKDDDTSKPPVHDYNRCIRCYCCQEICPYGAISVKTPLLGKLIRR